MTRYDNEQIIEMLKNLAIQLGQDTLSKKDISSVISVSTVNSRFGNMGNALKAAGLRRLCKGEHFRGRGQQIDDNDLFKALFDVETKIGHEPRYNECSAFCKYSVRPYTQRFGKWNDVLAYYKKWKLEDRENDSDAITNETNVDNCASADPKILLDVNKKKTPEQFYGEPIDFRGLRHAPINEQGVVFLFAMISRELGFNIESVQQGFPDCEGKYLYDRKKNLWAKARIEFEYKSSNFKQHAHDPNQCDFIVCWLDDWPECPIDVIELRSEIKKLPSR